MPRELYTAAFANEAQMGAIFSAVTKTAAVCICALVSKAYHYAAQTVNTRKIFKCLAVRQRASQFHRCLLVWPFMMSDSDPLRPDLSSPDFYSVYYHVLVVTRRRNTTSVFTCTPKIERYSRLPALDRFDQRKGHHLLLSLNLVLWERKGPGELTI